MDIRTVAKSIRMAVGFSNLSEGEHPERNLMYLYD